MKHLLLTLSVLLPLAACAPSNTPDAENNSSASSVAGALTIALEQNTVEDEMAVPHTTAQLVLSGAVDQTIVLPEITGELSAVSAAQAVAQLTAWFAGAGDEITLAYANGALVVTHISGDETGTCTDPVELASVTLPSDTDITLVGFQKTVDQSSLAFCHQ